MSVKAVRHAKTMHYPTMMFTGIAASLVLIGGYKFLYRPWEQEKRRLDAETVANTVFEHKIAQQKLKDNEKIM